MATVATFLLAMAVEQVHKDQRLLLEKNVTRFFLCFMFLCFVYFLILLVHVAYLY
jgi:hypothetical protein